MNEEYNPSELETIDTLKAELIDLKHQLIKLSKREQELINSIIDYMTSQEVKHNKYEGK